MSTWASNLACHFWPWSTFCRGKIHTMEIGQFLSWTPSEICLSFKMQLHSADQLGSLQKHDPWDRQMRLVPWGLTTSGFSTFLALNIDGAFTPHRSFSQNGSTTLFLALFLPPFTTRLFLLITRVLPREPKSWIVIFKNWNLLTFLCEVHFSLKFVSDFLKFPDTLCF